MRRRVDAWQNAGNPVACRDCNHIAQQQRCGARAELSREHKLVRPRQRSHHTQRASVALAGASFDTSTRKRDQGELGGRKERDCRDQQKNEEKG